MSRANKAGDRLRRMEVNLTGLDGYDRQAELEVLAAWRSQFQIPLVSTDMTLRSAVGTVTGITLGRGIVKQRFKRQEQIIAKLVRNQTRLSRMEDIGGCRAILPDLDCVREVADRIRSHATTVQVVVEDDYNDQPRPGGYRALHLHCMRDGVPIEIQLRTQTQHTWAERVEQWDGSTGHDIKHERGPAEVIQAFRLMADAMADREIEPRTPRWATLMHEFALSQLRDWFVREKLERRGGVHG